MASLHSSDLPSWQFSSHFHLAIANATLAFCGNTGAHDWINDGPCSGVTHNATCCQVCIRAASQVECVAIKDRIATDDIRRQRGNDVQLAVANERVVARAGRHLEFAISVPPRLITRRDDM
jgi:hypothetical protein